MRYYKIEGCLYSHDGKLIDKVQFFQRPFETAEDAALWLSLNYPCYLLGSKIYETDEYGRKKSKVLSFRAKDYYNGSVEDAILKIQEVIEIGFFDMALATV